MVFHRNPFGIRPSEIDPNKEWTLIKYWKIVTVEFSRVAARDGPTSEEKFDNPDYPRRKREKE